MLVTVHDDPELAKRGQAAGALGHVATHSAGRDLVPAIRAALQGQRYMATRDPP